MNQQAAPTGFGIPMPGGGRVARYDAAKVDPGRVWQSGVTGTVIGVHDEYFKQFDPKLDYADRSWAIARPDDGEPRFKTCMVVHVYVLEAQGVNRGVYVLNEDGKGGTWNDHPVQPGEIVRVHVDSYRKNDWWDGINAAKAAGWTPDLGCTVTMQFTHNFVDGKLTTEDPNTLPRGNTNPRKGWTITFAHLDPRISGDVHQYLVDQVELIKANTEERREANDIYVVGPEAHGFSPHGPNAPTAQQPQQRYEPTNVQPQYNPAPQQQPVQAPLPTSGFGSQPPVAPQHYPDHSQAPPAQQQPQQYDYSQPHYDEEPF